MDIKKWVPWNWFKKEEENAGKIIPVRHRGNPAAPSAGFNPIGRLHQDISQIFDNFLSEFGAVPFEFSRPFGAGLADATLRPTLDLSATDKEYTISVEIPGVDEKDLRIELDKDTLIIRGEKKLEKEEKERNYYRMERAYGSFQRMLSLPEDADREALKAAFKKGVLTVTMPRKALEHTNVKRIEVRSTD